MEKSMHRNLCEYKEGDKVVLTLGVARGAVFKILGVKEKRYGDGYMYDIITIKSSARPGVDKGNTYTVYDREVRTYCMFDDSRLNIGGKHDNS